MTLSVDVPANLSVEIDDLDLDDDHWRLTMCDYDQDTDDLLDEEKYDVSPRTDDLDETQIDISRESLSRLFARTSVLESTQTEILRMLRTIHDRLDTGPATPMGSTHSPSSARKKVHFTGAEDVAPRPSERAVEPTRQSAAWTAGNLKDLKPPSFGGEEKERNKDSVNIFLHKWSDIHTLRQSPEGVRLVEASLSLTGKAYKWWMSLAERATYPRTWAEFEMMF